MSSKAIVCALKPRSSFSHSGSSSALGNDQNPGKKISFADDHGEPLAEVRREPLRRPVRSHLLSLEHIRVTALLLLYQQQHLGGPEGWVHTLIEELALSSVYYLLSDS